MSLDNLARIHPETSGYGVHVGNTKGKEGVPGSEVNFYPSNASNYFMTVTGKSGAGKTFLIRKLLNQFQANGDVTCIVIDTQGDFSPMHFDSYIPGSSSNINHSCFDYINSPVTLNPFKITKTGSNSDYTFAFKNVIEAIKCFNPSLGSQQESLLNQIIDKAYVGAGIYPNEPDSWANPPPTIKDVLAIASSILAEVESGIDNSYLRSIFKTVNKRFTLKKSISKLTDMTLKDFKESYKRKEKSDDKLARQFDELEEESNQLKDQISNLIDQDDPSVFKKTSTTLERISSICNTLIDMDACSIFGGDTITIQPNKINVIDISELHPTTYPTLIHLLLYRTFQSSVLRKKRKKTADNKLSTLLVFDEGKIFASSSNNDMSPLKRIIEEGRKYELGGIFGLQNARQIPPAFLSNIATSFVLPVAPTDISVTASTYGIDKDVLKHLTPKKEALFASDSPGHTLVQT